MDDEIKNDDALETGTGNPADDGKAMADSGSPSHGGDAAPGADGTSAADEAQPADKALSAGDDAATAHSDYKPVNRFDASAVHHLSGMYQNWFLDYASYVIL